MYTDGMLWNMCEVPLVSQHNNMVKSQTLVRKLPIVTAYAIRNEHAQGPQLIVGPRKLPRNMTPHLRKANVNHDD